MCVCVEERVCVCMKKCACLCGRECACVWKRLCASVRGVRVCVYATLLPAVADLARGVAGVVVGV